MRGNTFQLWLEELGAPDTYGLVTRLVDIYRNHDPLLVPFPEVLGILRELSSRYRLGLLSDGYLGVQQRKLAALSLAGYFHGIVFSDSWGRENWKPSQRPFKEIANLLSLEPSRIVYVADNPLKDFLGARESGMFTVRLRRQDSEYGHWIPLLNSMRHMSRLVPSKCSLASCCRGPQKSLEKVGDLFQSLDLAHTDAKRLKNSLAQNPSFTRS